MQCSDIRDMLSPYLDGFLEPGEQEQLKAHLESCTDCQAQLMDLRGTVNLLKGLPEVTPPAGFRREIREKLQQLEGPGTADQKRAPKRASRLRIPGLMAAAAVLVVALGISGVWGSPARWFGSGEGLMAQLFSGAGSPGTVAMDNGKVGKLEDQAGGIEKQSLTSVGEAKEDAPESMDFNMAMKDDGLSEEEELRRAAAPPGAGIMPVPEDTPAEPQPLMMMETLNNDSTDGGPVVREARLVLTVTDQAQAMTEISAMANSHGAKVIASHVSQVVGEQEVDTVAIDLRIAFANFSPLWDELHDYAGVLNSSIIDRRLDTGETGDDQGDPAVMITVELKK